MDRRTIICAGLAAGLSARAGTARAQFQSPAPARVGYDLGEPIELWPQDALDLPPVALIERVNERAVGRSSPDQAISGITRPRLLVLQPERPNGAAVVVIPGGGYRHIIVDKEGNGMARWLAARGFTAFVLLYRLPGEGWADGADVSLIDAQRAVRIIRHRADALRIDPAKLGVVGFSAGGHVSASLSTRFSAAVYRPVDAADGLSARPHSAAAIYPVISMDQAIAHPGSRRLLLGDAPTKEREALYSPDCGVPADAPPHFLLHAEDDGVVSVENTLRFRAALKSQSVPVETHLFATGGHGFGLRKTGHPSAAWPELWLAWARAVGLE